MKTNPALPNLKFEPPMGLCCFVNPYKICQCGKAMCEDCYYDKLPKPEVNGYYIMRINLFIQASDDHRCIDGNNFTKGYDF